MVSRNRLTLMVLLTLSCGYFVYLFGVRIVLRAVPPDMPVANFSHPEELDPGIESFDESSRIAAKHLPDEAWARDAIVQFRDGDTLFYYAQEWGQSNEKRSVTFEPLALVWFPNDSDVPFVIQAESAVITFERDVDLSSPDPGRIVAGELLGDVTIRGDDGLSLKGHHFIFSEEAGSIFSDSPVEFAWQKHSGQSQQGIQIDLDMSSGGQNNQLAVSGVRQVHLFRNVAMDFLFEQDRDVIPLSVRCAGRFMLRLLGQADNPSSRSIASFEDKVVVTRATELNTADVLTCDQLDLHLEELSDAEKADRKLASVAKSQPDMMPGSGDSSIQLKRMRAKGYVVKVASQLNEFEAVVGSPNQPQRTLAVVDYDATERRLTLNDFDPNLAKQWKPRVRITQKSGEMDCQQISVTHHVDGRVNEIVCLGNGWLAYRRPGIDGAPTEDVLLADWKRQLRRFTDDTTGQNVIDLFGDAVVKMPEDQAGISADYIKIWTDPLEVSGSSSQFVSGKSLRKDSSDEKKVTPNPRRILAQKNVLLVSPQMHGQMEELQVWFEDAEPGSDSGRKTNSLTPVSFRIPEATAPQLLPDDSGDSGTLKEPVYVSAALTRVRIVRHGDDVEPEVREVWTEGDVRITHQKESADGPVILTGDRLHILNNDVDDQVIHLLGQPAQILDPRMKLTGDEIFFDRRRNLAWSDGSGELRLPTERDFDGEKLKEPAELTINWHEQMAFDGRVATFIGRVHASMFDSVMRCQQMEITMLKPVVFEQGAGTRPTERPEIATVTCQFDVEFNSHLIEDGTMKEVRRAKFARFHLDHQTGKVVADNGPGTVSLWRRGRGKRAGLAPLAAGGANRAMDTQGTEWEYSRIQFAREMSGSMKDRTTTFSGQIEVIYGPVDEPMAKIDLDNLPKDGGAMFCDWLEFVQRISSDGTKHVELLAKENARLEGRSFFAQADEISYDESKGLYMLRSSGDESILWREKVAGGERTAVVAETFRFIPSINKVEFDKASRVQGLQ